MNMLPEIGELIFRPCRTVRRNDKAVFEKKTPEIAKTDRRNTPYRMAISYSPALGMWTLGAQKGLIAFCVNEIPENYTHFKVVRLMHNAVQVECCPPDPGLLYASYPKHDPEVVGLGQLREIARRNAHELTQYLDDRTIQTATARGRMHDILLTIFDAGPEVDDIVSLKAALDSIALYANGITAKIKAGESTMPADVWSKIVTKLANIRSDLLNSLGRFEPRNQNLRVAIRDLQAEHAPVPEPPAAIEVPANEEGEWA